MGAFVSLAFGWPGSLEDAATLDQALEHAGLNPGDAGVSMDGMRVRQWILSFVGEGLPMTCRSYQRDGWVASTLDIDEELFEAVGNRHGRKELTRTLIHIGEELLRRLHLQYVFFDEEAEADIDPEEYQADTLFGITLVADDVPGLEAARHRQDVLRAEPFEGGVVLFRRLDPVPHYYYPPEDGGEAGSKNS